MSEETPFVRVHKLLGGGYTSINIISGRQNRRPVKPVDGLSWIGSQLWHQIERSYASRCRNPHCNPQVGRMCSNEHSFEFGTADLNCLDAYCERVARLVWLLDTNAMPELSGTSHQSFRLDLRGSFDDWHATISLPELPSDERGRNPCGSFRPVVTSRGTTVQAVLDAAFLQCHDMVTEELLFLRLLKRFRRVHSPTLEPNFRLTHPYFQLRSDGQLVASWKLSTEGHRHAVGANRIEAMRAAIAKAYVCDYDGARGCVLPLGHEGDHEPIDARKAARRSA